MENNLKKIRKKLNLTQKDFAKILKTSQSQISLYEKGIKTIPENLKVSINSLLSKKEISEFEKEILETYEMLREENNPFTAIASFKRSLINLNQEISKTSININTLEENPDFKKISTRLKRPIKTTLKYLELLKNQLNDILNDDYIMIEEEDINESE
jgi:DNA-binding protein